MVICLRIDEKDSKILELLKKNAEVSNAEIGEKIGLTEGAVRKRIANLKQDGIIKKYTIEINEEAEAVGALVFVHGESGIVTEKIVGEIKKIGEVKTIFELTGDNDICAILSTNSMEKLNDAIDKIRNISGVADTKTQIVLKKWD